MTIKKLYLDEFGNVITAEDGDSMSNGLLLNGVGLSAGREPNQNTEELVKRWNAYDANQEEIAELKSLAAYAEQRANIAEKANDALVLKNASLNSQAVNQVKMFNEKVDEIAELKAMIDEFIEEFSCFVAQHECNCGHPSCRTCKECRDAFKVLDNAVKLREGES